MKIKSWLPLRSGRWSGQIATALDFRGRSLSCSLGKDSILWQYPLYLGCCWPTRETWQNKGGGGERTCNGLKCHPGVRRVAIILMVTLCCGKPDKFCAAGQLAGEDLTFFFFSYFSFSMRRRGDTPVMICYLTPFFATWYINCYLKVP